MCYHCILLNFCNFEEQQKLFYITTALTIMEHVEITNQLAAMLQADIA